MRFAPRRAARRDKNEAQIIKGLRTLGFLVWQDLPVDLLVGKGKKLKAFEVKSKKGKLTEGQAELFKIVDNEKVPFYVVRSLEEILARMAEE